MKILLGALLSILLRTTNFAGAHMNLHHTRHSLHHIPVDFKLTKLVMLQSTISELLKLMQCFPTIHVYSQIKLSEHALVKITSTASISLLTINLELKT